MATASLILKERLQNVRWGMAMVDAVPNIGQQVAMLI